MEYKTSSGSRLYLLITLQYGRGRMWQVSLQCQLVKVKMSWWRVILGCTQFHISSIILFVPTPPPVKGTRKKLWEDGGIKDRHNSYKKWNILLEFSFNWLQEMFTKRHSSQPLKTTGHSATRYQDNPRCSSFILSQLKDIQFHHLKPLSGLSSTSR